MATKKNVKNTNNAADSKDENIDKVAAPEITESEAETGIDSSVFEDVEDDFAESEEFDLPISDYAHRSTTIDEGLIYNNKAKKKVFGKKNEPTVDITKVERFKPDPAFGLDQTQVDVRMEQQLHNFVKKKASKSILSIFLTNIFTFFNMLCFGVAIALIVVGATITQLFFMVIILANVSIGIFQEIRSKLTIEKLSLMTAPTAFVMRHGEKMTIPTGEVVLDDILCLELGKQICADSVVVSGECEVNESLLTGESVPVKKVAGDSLYAGSFVSSGTCKARVDKVGKGNYIETLASYAQKYKKPKSELMNSVKLIIKVLSPFIIIIGALTVWISYNNIFKANGVVVWADWNSIISSASGSVIGMIPSGMMLLTSLALAVSVMRLAKKHTLVQDLYCIEMLARVDVLCFDKTGTITDGTMQVNNVIEVKGFESKFTIPEIIGSMLTATEDNNQTALALANKFGYSGTLTAKTVMPFSSQRKLSAVTFTDGNGTFMLGAPEFVLKDMGLRMTRIINENAANGYRVMVLAHSPADIVNDKLPTVRRPVCLLIIEDHIREDAYKTVEWFKENNVDVRVISGDNPVTVSEVARRVGVANAEKYISLDGLSNQEVIEAANAYTVFGRVTPEQKRLLVKSIKSKGHTVAMTGDGVNDILAMREADCAVSVASAAEAARNVSHLVLMNNDFTSMPDVVMEGRRVVNNIQNSSSLYLMKTFLALVLSIIFLAMRQTYPFSTNNMLILEVGVIGVPSFFLALQTNKNIIKGRFLSNVLSRAVPGGVALVLGVMAVYLYGMFMPGVPKDVITCMMIIVLVGVGLMVLYKLCEPYTVFRVCLMIGSTLLCAVIMIVIPTLGLVWELTLTDSLFVACCILLSYFIIAILTKLLLAVNWK